MPISDLQQAAQQIASFLNSVIRRGGLRLKYRVSASPVPEGSLNEGAQVLNVELTGPDASMLTHRNGELLRALEHIAIQILRLDVREHDLVNFQSGTPYSFPPTNSRERRLYHMAFKEIEDVETASVGEGQDRYLVVYPKGKTHLPAPIPQIPSRARYDDNRGNRIDRGRDDGGRGGRPRRDRDYNRF
jgi:spoIIIJ-associated protein